MSRKRPTRYRQARPTDGLGTDAADAHAAPRWELGWGVVSVLVGGLAVTALPFLFAGYGSPERGAQPRAYVDQSTAVSSGAYRAHDLVVEVGAGADVVAVEVAEFPFVFALPWAGRTGLEIGTIDLADPDAGLTIPPVLVQTSRSMGSCVEAERIVEVDGTQIAIRVFLPSVTARGGLLIDARDVVPDRLAALVVRLHYEDGSTEDLRADELTRDQSRQAFAGRFTGVTDACTAPTGGGVELPEGTSYNWYRLHDETATYLGRGQL